MKTFPHSSQLLILIVLAASSSFGTTQTAKAETTQPKRDMVTTESGAAVLGQPQIQQTDPTLKRPTRELPTFKVDAKPQRSRGGILSILGGRFVHEDRHPSFRKSTLPTK